MVASEIEELIGLLEGKDLPSVAGFEVEVRDQLRQPSTIPASAARRKEAPFGFSSYNSV
jgi:hypothetical protein